MGFWFTENASNLTQPIPGTASVSTPICSPAKTKKSFKDLFQDKKFLWAIPVFLLLTGGFLWIIADPSGTPVETETPSALNVGVPNAASDSIMGNRLDLSVEGTQGPTSQPGAMQGIPGGDKYAYGQRYKPQSGNPAAGAMSSLPDPVTGMATPQNSGSQGFPTGVNRRATPSMPFTESDMRITDDDAVRTPEDGRALAAKRAGLANIVDKQARMERALAAYNQDKQARIARENDKTIIQKVNVDENGQPYYTMKMVHGVTLKKVLAQLADGDTAAALNDMAARKVTGKIVIQPGK